MVQYIYLKSTSYFTLIALILVMALGSVVNKVYAQERLLSMGAVGRILLDQRIIGSYESLNLTIEVIPQENRSVTQVEANVVIPNPIPDKECTISFDYIDNNQWQLPATEDFRSKCGNQNGKYVLHFNARDSVGEETDPNKRPRISVFVGMPPLESGVDFSGNSLESNSEFVGGVSVNRGNYERSQVLKSSSEGHVLGAIEVDPAHVNQSADIFAYAQFSGPGSEGYYMLGKKDPNGNNAPVLSWDGNLTTLATHEDVNLEQTQEISIYQGLFPVGTYKIYFGYRLPENGMLVRNSQPIEVTVY